MDRVYTLKHILDGMVDMVRVVDVNNNIVLMNKRMKEVMGDLTGQKCHSIFGCQGVCENCISRRAIAQRLPYYKTEVLNGRTYSVLSSPIVNPDGEVEAAVEVFRDVTEEQRLREQVMHHNNKMLHDLEFARKIQHSFLPGAIPQAHPYAFSALYHPCEAVGGDIYDVFQLDEDHVGFYIADVAGHGVTAAMLTVFLKEAIRNRVKGKSGITPPARVLEGLFKRFQQVDLEEHFYITLFYGVLNIRSGALRYSNAGHSMPPLLADQGVTTPVILPGLPICRWFDQVQYDEAEVFINPGARLLLYTDGLVEVGADRSDQDMGEIAKFLIQENRYHGKQLLDSLLDRARKKHKMDHFRDDITMLLIERQAG